MGIANPIETIIGILTVIDQVRAKMEGTPLAGLSPWLTCLDPRRSMTAELVTMPPVWCKSQTIGRNVGV